MATIGFIGLGNMGGPMARNLIKAGHSLKVFDLSEEAMNFVVQSGAEAAKSAADAATNVDAVVTMLPVGDNVRSVYVDAGVLDAVSEGTLMIESSTIDVETARAMHAAAAERGYQMVDAPVSGGTAGADAGTLTFMCGGEAAAFAQARPIPDAAPVIRVDLPTHRPMVPLRSHPARWPPPNVGTRGARHDGAGLYCTRMEPGGSLRSAGDGTLQRGSRAKPASRTSLRRVAATERMLEALRRPVRGRSGLISNG